MLKDSLEKPLAMDNTIPKSVSRGHSAEDQMPRNLEIANTQTGLQIVEDPFSVRATDISPINKDEIKVINSMKDNIALLSQSCKDGQLSTNNPAS